MTMINSKGIRVAKCPIGQEYCYPSCYFYKDRRCYFKSKHLELKKKRGSGNKNGYPDIQSLHQFYPGDAGANLFLFPAS
jgi:hypothetical protein